MFEMVLHEKVLLQDDRFIIGEGHYSINRDNFEEFREVVMKSNLVYKPLIGKNLRSNNVIQKAFETKSSHSPDISLDSMIATVSMKRNLSDEQILDYTWYRLMFDFNLISREHFNHLLFMARVIGGEMDIPNLSEPIELYKNPYDGILVPHKNNNGFDKAVTNG